MSRLSRKRKSARAKKSRSRSRKALRGGVNRKTAAGAILGTTTLVETAYIINLRQENRNLKTQLETQNTKNDKLRTQLNLYENMFLKDYTQEDKEELIKLFKAKEEAYDSLLRSPDNETKLNTFIKAKDDLNTHKGCL